MAKAPESSNAPKLQATVQWAGGVLIAQGVLGLLVGPRSSTWLNLRFSEEMAPYILSGACAQITLGLFVLRAIREGQRQYFAIDSLTLACLLQPCLLMGQRLHGYRLTWAEWLWVAVDLGLAYRFMRYRTRGIHMEASEPSWTTRDVLPYLDKAKEAVSPLAERLRRVPQPGAVAAVPDPAPVQAPVTEATAPAPPSPPPPPKPVSTALPHMD